MSIMNCDSCERPVDTDFHPMNEVDGKNLCEGCDPGEEPEELSGALKSVLREAEANGGPVHPCEYKIGGGTLWLSGMSLRDWFATHASEQDIARFQEFEASDVPFPAMAVAIYSREAARYRFADAMLKARGEVQ